MVFKWLAHYSVRKLWKTNLDLNKLFSVDTYFRTLLLIIFTGMHRLFVTPV